MGSEERLGFTLPTGRVTRGDVIRVRLSGDVAQYRSVRLELLQVQRKPKAKSNHAVVMNTVAVPDGAVQVELTVPGSLPNAYSGTVVGWDYEVRLIGDRPGRPDHEQVEAIDLQGTEPTSGSDISLLSLRSSYASGIARLVTKDARQRGATIQFAVIGVVSLLVGLISGGRTWLIMGGISLLLSSFGAVSMYRKRRHGLHDVQFQCPDTTIRLGRPVVVQVGNAIGDALEVGLVALEISVEGSGKHIVAVRHVAYEQWAPVIGPTVTFPTVATMPSGFVGERNALHWMVILRRSDAKRSVRDLSARTTLLAITH